MKIKILSARWIMTISLTWSLCWGFIKGLVPPEAFIPIVLLCCEWYFKREDRDGTN